MSWLTYQGLSVYSPLYVAVEGLVLTLIASHSGIRGVYGRGLTADLAMRLTRAFVESWSIRKVIVGRDTRPSSESIECAVLSALAELGCRAYVVGVQPTPVILWACRRMGADGAIIISASHNPPEWNALKFALRGLFLDADEVSKLLEAVEGTVPASEVGKIGESETCSYDPLEEYVGQALRVLDVEAVKRRGLKVVVDPGGGAGFRSTPLLLRRLGCKVVTVNSAPGIFARDIEPAPSSLELLSKAVKAYKADVGFAHDADADRLVCVTEEGEVLGEDYSLAIASLHVLERRRGPLVVSTASSMMFKWISEQLGVELYWSPVGEVKVVKEIIKRGAPIGGEGSSGGVIPAFFNLARDGVFGAALIVEALALKGYKVSDFVRELPRYHQVRTAIDCDVERSELIVRSLAEELRGLDLDLTDGVKVWLDEGWVLIRPSRTEPKIRIICEARSRARAESLLKDYTAKAQEVIKKVAHI
jgi:phosphoglucosamine mutase